MAPESATTFEDVRFTVGPISGDYVFILGRPSLTTFDIWVSLKNRQIVNRRSALPIFDYRVGASSNTCAVSALLIPYPCTTMESTILAEYSTFFHPTFQLLPMEPTIVPISLRKLSYHPQVSTTALCLLATMQSLMSGSTLSLANISWRGKPYWNNIWTRDVYNGSSSQYASPSMIVPQKDPKALPWWVCNYMKLNEVTVRDCSPLPNVDELVCLVAPGSTFPILDQTNCHTMRIV
ncbi:hypothetical protein PSTT_00197 [Puccinia striiformis]|uniref:Uncharacterized protein n=1 Tax=Puccinia striiformis TaxID=27350 RepID=A0A2S4W802_9BASI|nr:hypothetical protein PSTT_00197 [Puccinia striiformis]